MLLLLAACTWIPDADVKDRVAGDSAGAAYDLDGDGYAAVADGGADCWDDPDARPDGFTPVDGAAPLEAAEVHPGATDAWYDGVDADCDGASDFDQDGDGHDTSNHPQADGSVGDDCYDTTEDPYPQSGDLLAVHSPEDVHPGAEDPWYDGTDQDCDGHSDYDQDYDGYDAGVECDDADAGVYPDPSVDEVWYDDVDDNCDGNLYDKDGDGHDSADYGGDDCWDDPDEVPDDYAAREGSTQPAAGDVYPGADDAPYDGVDADCAGGDDDDADGDGFDAAGVGGDDCDDGDATVYPGASDAWYDGVDGDCDGASDYDADGDGFESDSYGGDDCDDARAGVNPDAGEECGTAYDDDCDGAFDAEDALGCSDWYLDADGDGYGAAPTACWCDAQADYSATVGGDCDDADAGDHPGASEIDGNGDDEDCDGSDGASGGVDDDGDGYTTADDCDDTDAAVNPGADELCDGMDDDCDGSTDEADAIDASTWYADDDGDGFGDAAVTAVDCDLPAGYAADDADCDDASSSDHPGATEVVDNGDDEDCDGEENCYSDADNDGYAESSGTLRGSVDTDCTDAYEASSTDPRTDCDDGNSSINPAATEVCDASNTDEDCDGASDNNDSSASSSGKTRYYLDADGDAYGDDSDAGALYCDLPSGRSSLHTDCNDADATVYPGAYDPTGDTYDQDCDGTDG